MPQLTLITRDAEPHALEADSDLTLMEAIQNAGYDELLATCGGCCSCATCHVHLDPATFASLPPPNELEGDLLDSSDYRDATSRLSCQVMCRLLPDGAVVTIAKED